MPMCCCQLLLQARHLLLAAAAAAAVSCLPLTDSVSSCVWMLGLSRQRLIARYTLSQLPLQDEVKGSSYVDDVLLL
jgi:hypothetical protein